MIKQFTLFILLSIAGMQLIGCDKCSSSGSPSSVGLTEVTGQCLMTAAITCTCSGGGALSSCGAGSQTFEIGSVAPGVFPPCPATFTCDGLATCT